MQLDIQSCSAYQLDMINAIMLAAKLPYSFSTLAHDPSHIFIIANLLVSMVNRKQLNWSPDIFDHFVLSINSQDTRDEIIIYKEFMDFVFKYHIVQSIQQPMTTNIPYPTIQFNTAVLYTVKNRSHIPCAYQVCPLFDLGSLCNLVVPGGEAKPIMVVDCRNLMIKGIQGGLIILLKNDNLLKEFGNNKNKSFSIKDQSIFNHHIVIDITEWLSSFKPTTVEDDKWLFVGHNTLKIQFNHSRILGDIVQKGLDHLRIQRSLLFVRHNKQYTAASALAKGNNMMMETVDVDTDNVYVFCRESTGGQQNQMVSQVSMAFSFARDLIHKEPLYLFNIQRLNNEKVSIDSLNLAPLAIMEISSSYLYSMNDRVQLQHLLTLISYGDVVIVVHIDRLTRRLDEFISIWTQFKNLGIRLMVLNNLLEFQFTNNTMHYQGGLYIDFSSDFWSPFFNGSLTQYNGEQRKKVNMFGKHFDPIIGIDAIFRIYCTQMEYSIQLCYDHSIYTQRYYQSKDIINTPSCINDLFMPFFKDITEGYIICRTSGSIRNADSSSIPIQSTVATMTFPSVNSNQVFESQPATMFYKYPEGQQQTKELETFIARTIWPDSILFRVHSNLLKGREPCKIITSSIDRLFRDPHMFNYYFSKIIPDLYENRVGIVILFPPMELLKHLFNDHGIITLGSQTHIEESVYEQIYASPVVGTINRITGRDNFPINDRARTHAIANYHNFIKRIIETDNPRTVHFFPITITTDNLSFFQSSVFNAYMFRTYFQMMMWSAPPLSLDGTLQIRSIKSIIRQTNKAGKSTPMTLANMIDAITFSTNLHKGDVLSANNNTMVDRKIKKDTLATRNRYETIFTNSFDYGSNNRQTQTVNCQLCKECKDLNAIGRYSKLFCSQKCQDDWLQGGQEPRILFKCTKVDCHRFTLKGNKLCYLCRDLATKITNSNNTNGW
ncbi:hypothetical protein SAMD00019534_012220 [Acytostelium subglobosum LB1]|uniref:hypothetical protein n=1 Tax=Acytostelium subglobosum LB1 TaxID=1410327 RepID=UPI000645232D|nr:hypothetical protein SAMD00019534_012220 [Acytostelium subglobosum LB1]GAM18047.1 hypothetical protein SAMD00019534_012220 [Acytostelium subglobosum LB1]|eukprot:XP_012758643.1 hypothetical protein SAMD00019534_012220 [Acytostelium subglobosum LB1]